MIKALSRAGDKPLILIGLSAENMRRLMDDQPIRFDLADLGLPSATVAIIGGQTEESIAQQLASHGIQIPSATCQGSDDRA